MSDKTTEQAAEEYAIEHCNGWTQYKPMLKAAFKAGDRQNEAQLTAAHEKIAEMEALVPKWIPIDEFPKDKNPTVMRWHKIWKCLVSVKHRLGYVENGLEWIDGTLSHTWPEAAFTPMFYFMPDWDNYTPPESSTPKQQ